MLDNYRALSPASALCFLVSHLRAMHDDTRMGCHTTGAVERWYHVTPSRRGDVVPSDQCAGIFFFFGWFLRLRTSPLSRSDPIPHPGRKGVGRRRKSRGKVFFLCLERVLLVTTPSGRKRNSNESEEWESAKRPTTRRREENESYFRASRRTTT